MRSRRKLEFCGQTYWEGAGGDFQVPLSVATELRLGDIPAHSTVEVTDLPKVSPDYNLSIRSTNHQDAGEFDELNISTGIFVTVDEHVKRRISRVQRLYAPLEAEGRLPKSDVLRIEYSAAMKMASVGWSLQYPDQPEVLLGNAVAPILEKFGDLSSPDVHLFLCHASEDKNFVERLAEFLRGNGASVWLDRWEIKVGDSIVQKVNDGLSSATHLAVVLSSRSVNKPWVKREMSSALMRQLANNSVSVIPIVIDDCLIPAILADIKYADCRSDIDAGLKDLLEALG